MHKLLLAGLSATAFATTAMSQPASQGPYISGGFGYVLTGEIWGDIGPFVDRDFALEDTLGIQAAFGYDYRIYRLELQGVLHEYETGAGNSQATAQLFGNVWFRLYDAGRYDVYAGAGAGPVFAEDGSGALAQAGIGTRIHVTDRIWIDPGLRTNIGFIAGDALDIGIAATELRADIGFGF